MTQPRRTVTFTDELLADKSVHRRYSDGRQEWRRRQPDGSVQWTDSAGGSGTDERLADGIVKRTQAGGVVLFGREQGYGRTFWSDGTLTINRSSFGGRLGRLLAALGAAALLGALVPPPQSLGAAEEEALRQKAREQMSGADVSVRPVGDDGDGGGPDDDPVFVTDDDADWSDEDADFSDGDGDG